MFRPPASAARSVAGPSVIIRFAAVRITLCSGEVVQLLVAKISSARRGRGRRGFFSFSSSPRLQHRDPQLSPPHLCPSTVTFTLYPHCSQYSPMPSPTGKARMLFSGSCLVTSFRHFGVKVLPVGRLASSAAGTRPPPAGVRGSLPTVPRGRNGHCLTAKWYAFPITSRWNQNAPYTTLQSGLFFEISYRVRRDIIRPVISMQGFVRRQAETIEQPSAHPMQPDLLTIFLPRRSISLFLLNLRPL